MNSRPATIRYESHNRDWPFQCPKHRYIWNERCGGCKAARKMYELQTELEDGIRKHLEKGR